MKSSRWTMVIVGVIALLMIGDLVSASPPSSGPSVPPQATVGFDADMVDGLHATSPSASGRAGKLVNVGSNGRFPLGVMPTGSLDLRYVNDDRQETIQAAVAGVLLTVENTGEGGGVLGSSGRGSGVRGYSSMGRGVWASSYLGVPLYVDGAYGSNLIEAWDAAASNLRFKVTRSGDVYIDGDFYNTGADFAEMMATSEGVTYEPGDLLVVGPDGKPLPSSAPNTTNLLGVYSTDPGFVGGAGDDEETEGKIPVAITGIVPVKASAENGAILPGDLLTSSCTPGHAMKAAPVTMNGITFYLPGTIIGKALEPLEEGTGVILALVTLQ